MWIVGPIGFLAPWLLLGLLALPILWLLLRAVPPAPVRRMFPGVALLLGLTDDDHQSDRTPWWLLLLRTLAVAAVIAGFAGPVLNPQDRVAGDGPLLILLDGTWADAADWPRRIERVRVALDEAAQDQRTVAVATLTDPPTGALAFQAPGAWNARLPGIAPAAWAPVADAADWIAAQDGAFDTLWLSDGLARAGRDDMLAALEARGSVRVVESPRDTLGLQPATFADGVIALGVQRSSDDGPRDVVITAEGLDPNGVERVLARADARFADGARAAEIALTLPAELRNRVTRFTLEGVRSAAAVSLTDDALRRREVALIAGRDDREGLRLLSPTHYLEQALAPVADLIDGAITDVLPANPDVIVLADVATLTGDEQARLADWVEGGGLLVRFAGPRLAASDVGRDAADPLMPVRLRAGGRSVGGAMSWGDAKRLRPFADGSPFAGLAVPGDVTVSAQVMAQPDPDLAARVIASLEDGTPLITRKALGAGQVVLFHVTANADWSTLPLSGLFVQMLERLAVSTRPAQPEATDLAGTVWTPDVVLDAFGRVRDAADTADLGGIDGAALAVAEPGPQTPPGLYAGSDRRIALNVMGPDAVLEPTVWPARVPVEGIAVPRETALKGTLLTAAILALAVDVLASLALGGRLRGPRAGPTRGPATAGGVAGRAAGTLAGRAAGTVAGAVGGVALVALLLATPAMAQDGDAPRPGDDFALAAAGEAVLAHVVTGDAEIDRIAAAGLRGLTHVLFARTSIEASEPIAVNVETDELAFFPLLYWPVTPDQPTPSDEAYSRLNSYLRTGGMIVFDTRDADVAGYGAASPNGRALQRLAAPLDIPPLEPIPPDHVLTRTFYLLQEFPGRYPGRDVWVEAAPPDAEQVEGMPFRNLNDNVTPVVIGGNDWAAAWAVDARGNPLFPVGRGYAGERQREIALRFGVNLTMHVLTGNYKSDQVHVPALLDRLGQ